jgi:hypothetical protein
MKKIQLFLQFEGNRRIELIEVDADSPVQEIIAAALRVGLPEDCRAEACVFGEEGEEPLDLGVTLTAAGVRDKHRIHVHRCRKIAVTLHFNDVTDKHHFPPSATVERVKRYFVHKIHMSPVDATEHVLQICGTTDRPEPDQHIGALVSCTCSVCFDLVPIKRVEG